MYVHMQYAIAYVILCRQKRTVDYRQFADGNSDEDGKKQPALLLMTLVYIYPLVDDFASSSVLPRKARTAERAPVRVKGSVEAGDTQRGKKEREGETLAKRPRQSRDERRFSKDTEKVLRESLDAPSLSPSPSPRDRDNGDHVETRHSSNPGKSGTIYVEPDAVGVCMVSVQVMLITSHHRPTKKKKRSWRKKNLPVGLIVISVMLVHPRRRRLL